MAKCDNLDILTSTELCHCFQNITVDLTHQQTHRALMHVYHLAVCKHHSERTHTLTWWSVCQAASATPSASAKTHSTTALLVVGAYTYTHITTLSDIILSVVGAFNYIYITTLSDITQSICREAHHIAAGTPEYQTVLAAPWRSDRCQSHAPPA